MEAESRVEGMLPAPIGGHAADGDVELDPRAGRAPFGSGPERRGGLVRRLAAGLTGAVALNVAHEIGWRVRRDAPRVDKIGERAVKALARTAGVRRPRGRALRRWALTGDLVSNTLYYAALVSTGARRPWTRALLGGLAAGAGAVRLPPLLGLGRLPRAHRRAARRMAVGWYVLGGLAAAACFRLLGGNRHPRPAANHS